MEIQYCTITGADDQVDVEDLISLSCRYPFVEWGILCSKSRAETPRYPSTRWIANFVDAVLESSADVNRSAHLCGQYARDFVSHEFKHGFLECFQRVQVNGSFDDLNALYYAVKFAEPIKVITQHNKANEGVLSALLARLNHQILFDASGGCGILGEWQTPFPSITCGYAGGLSPDNLQDELTKIERVAGDRCVWVDMESGVRTDNQFDLDKVERALHIVEGFNTRGRSS
jgi:hypothetical protein